MRSITCKVAVLNLSVQEHVVVVAVAVAVVVALVVVVAGSYTWEVWMTTWQNQTFVITSLPLEMLVFMS